MKISNIHDATSWFAVLCTSRKSQVATMTLSPGKSSSPKGNEHPKSDQVLFVIDGEVLAQVGNERATLTKGDVMIVPAGAAHRFTNRSASPALTVNAYAPPRPTTRTRGDERRRRAASATAAVTVVGANRSRSRAGKCSSACLSRGRFP